MAAEPIDVLEAAEVKLPSASDKYNSKTLLIGKTPFGLNNTAIEDPFP